MLDYLLEGRAEELTGAAERAAIEDCLEREYRLLLDTEHLQKNVIDYPRGYAWDFTGLGPGFMELVGPYLQLHARSGELFLAVLHELGAYRPQYLQAVLLLEHSHYSMLINDHYTLQEEFTLKEPDPRRSSRLTQLKYAGQYVHIYPRYLLKNNVFGVSTEKLIKLHQWVSGCYIALGMGRGVFVKWSENSFRQLNLAQYSQCAINMLSNYMIYPVILATVFAGISGAEQTRLKRAMSHLTLFAKMRCEKNEFLQRSAINDDARLKATALLLNFPGFLICQFGLEADTQLDAALRVPGIYRLRDAFAGKIGKLDRDEVLRFYTEQEARCWESFEAEMKHALALPATLAALRRCYGIE